MNTNAKTDVTAGANPGRQAPGSPPTPSGPVPASRDPGRRDDTVTRAAARLVIAGLVILALLPPLSVAVGGSALTWSQAGADLARLDWLLAREPAPAPDEDLPVVLAQPPYDSTRDARLLLDGAGSIVLNADVTRPLAWPAVSRRLLLSLPIATPDGQAVTLMVRRSLRPVIDMTLLAGLASTLLALALWGWAFMRHLSALGLAEERVRAFSSSDRLTGLLNRDALRRRLSRALAGYRDAREGPRRTVGLLVIDVDRFGLVNGTLGQPAGDALLRHVAERLVAITRETDQVARLGGDQFAILVEGVSGTPALAAMARNLLRAFEQPCRVAGHETVVTLSIGVIAASGGNDTIDSVLRGADAAMRAAKQGGGGRFRIYEPTMAVDAVERLAMDVRLHRALANDEFFLMYQPVVDASGRKTVAIEALARWADPGRGLIAPDEFIPILEQTGMIVPVGRRLLYQACRSAVAWIRGGAADLTVAVNVSPRQFAEPDFVNTVLDALALTGLPPPQLLIEVTEGLLLDPAADAVAKIDALASAGVQLAVDDFGMGYSSLAYLKRFRLHALKIDRMLLRDVATHPQDAAIVRAIVELGRGLGLKVVAEGVETRAQFDALRSLGCDAMQGFLFSKPLPVERIRAHLIQDEPLVGLSETEPAITPAPAAGVAGTVPARTLFTS